MRPDAGGTFGATATLTSVSGTGLRSALGVRAGRTLPLVDTAGVAGTPEATAAPADASGAKVQVGAEAPGEQAATSALASRTTPTGRDRWERVRIGASGCEGTADMTQPMLDVRPEPAYGRMARVGGTEWTGAAAPCVAGTLLAADRRQRRTFRDLAMIGRNKATMIVRTAAHCEKPIVRIVPL